MSDKDFIELLRERGREQPLAAALGIVGQPALTYAQLADRIDGVANRLHRSGFRPGDRMLFSIRPCPDAVVLILGTIAAGGTIVFVDPGVGPELFARRIELARPGWAATESLLYALGGPLQGAGRRLGLSLPEFAKLPVHHIHSGPRLPGTPKGSIPAQWLLGPSSPAAAPTTGTAPADPPGGWIPGRPAHPDPLPHEWISPGFMPDAQPAAGPAAADPAAEALIVFTSGTTAAPKAVVHTRGSLGAGLAAVAGRSSVARGAHLHTEQLMIGLPALMAGARWSMPRYPRFGTHIDPLRFTRQLEPATHAFFTPADLSTVLTAVESGRLRAPGRLREISLGGAPVTANLLRRATAALPGCEFLAIYGMTEILPVAITSGAAKLGYTGSGDLIGAPVDGITAHVAGDGELILSGPNLCRGYLGEPPLTEIATGDFARFDGDELVLLGRKKDMMIRGKTNIYPGLYEPAIGAVAGVRQAVMVGLPDQVGDERIVLAVVPEPGSGDVEARLRRELPALIDISALPDDIVTVAEIPVSGRTSKPDRALLRALLADRMARAGR
ncbi:acyl--CoA ligase [Nocardia yamanashiensis]|uniref:class I adenylate-forming enzyme family protein n=1 Tax=Nocardia yamanashiensis TaxID=209247 RepID=UPI001E56ADC5|nr:class I adenylate-forming enzyme family protein [Nocardia yamanashiensis]UGT39283.1 acyl--CoA ligase [Nocardia yamanashiensis]